MRNVIIIGSGPAGYTAAIYASRGGLKPLMFEGIPSGGQLMITSDVENFPGFPKGIHGPELMANLRAQAERFGTELVTEMVTKVDFSKRPLRVWSGDRVEEGHTVIICTGASANLLGLESERTMMSAGQGVSACATCDGPLFRNKELVVVGGGDSAMEEGHFLTKFASKVSIVHRRKEFRASKIMIERCQTNPKVKFVTDVVIEDILDPAQEMVTGVKLRNLITGERSFYPCQGVFVAIGHSPNTSLFKGVLDLDEKGYILHKRFTETNVAGVFAAGDVVDKRYRQAISAAGMGCSAALDAEKYLQESGMH